MPPRSIQEFAAAALREQPVLELVRLEGAWREIPSSELDRRSLELAAALVTYGLEPGARVAALTPHGSEALLGFLSVLRAAGTFVPLAPTLPDDGLLEALRRLSVRQILVSGDDQLGRLQTIRPDLPELDLILLFHEPGRGRAAALTVSEARAFGADALAGEPGLLKREPPGGGEAPAVRLEAEGREVSLADGNLLAAAEATGAALAIERGEVVVSALPASDVAHLTLALACLARGARLAHVPSPDGLGDALLAVRPEVVVFPRALAGDLRGILEAAARAGTWLGRSLLRLALREGEKRGRPDLAAGRLPETRTWGWRAADALVVRRIRRATGGRLTRLVSLGEPLPPDESGFLLSLGMPFLEGLAVAEAGGLVSVNRPGAIRQGTAGKPVPGLEARTGEGGALEFRGAMVSGEGWRSVPVRGRLDGDGYVAGVQAGESRRR
jgi:long-chain acyl-CoA synthetase